MKIEPILIESINTIIYFYIGKNARDNFSIIDISELTDIWFHIDKESSCHVIARVPFNNYLNPQDLIENDEIIIRGALLCKNNTAKFKNSNTKITVIYDYLKNIKKTKTIGCVNINENTIKSIKI